ncbi:MAG TPA: hypothetical protein PLM29_13095, partial [Deltaproteobacteria bacterium]|nr:hypothetical protein [Deltaproteobacteria bacterium]
MEHVMKEKLQNVQLGKAQQFRNVSVYPLFLEAKAVVDYLVLKEAIEQDLVVIREVDEGGHVPELVVVNNADKPLLILDGEELFGAKQNRVLNTTVLLHKKSATIIPVSCTEQGRWHYESKTFKDSGYIMSPRIRGVKNRSVQESLYRSGAYRSDQGAVWNGIHEQAVNASVQSPTGAMRDIHEARKADMGDYEQYFPCLEGQNGILVAIGGSVVGMDMVSNGGSYAMLHGKLMKSYLMDAILQDTEPSQSIDQAKAQQFIDDIAECQVDRYKSVGHGWDLRYEGRRLFGSALEYRKGLVHLAAFAANGVVQRNNGGGMAG